MDCVLTGSRSTAIKNKQTDIGAEQPDEVGRFAGGFFKAVSKQAMEAVALFGNDLDNGVKYLKGPCIGGGNFAKVFIAKVLNEQGRLDRCAIKIMHEGVLIKDSEPEPQVYGEGFLVKQMGEKLSHPNILKVIGAKIESLPDGSQMLHQLLTPKYWGDLDKYMEYMKEPFAKKKGNIPMVLGLSRIIEVLEGVQYLNEAGFAHCDLKPGNVFVQKNGQAVIGDFGDLWPLGSDLKPGGTAAYKAPEGLLQAEESRLTPEYDVWAVALMLFGVVLRFSKNEEVHKPVYDLSDSQLPSHAMDIAVARAIFNKDKKLFDTQDQEGRIANGYSNNPFVEREKVKVCRVYNPSPFEAAVEEVFSDSKTTGGLPHAEPEAQEKDPEEECELSKLHPQILSRENTIKEACKEAIIEALKQALTLAPEDRSSVKSFSDAIKRIRALIFSVTTDGIRRLSPAVSPPSVLSLSNGGV